MLLKDADSDNLKAALATFSATRKDQHKRLQEVFKCFDVPVLTKKCEVIELFMAEIPAKIFEIKDNKGPEADTVIINVIQRMEHYFIATYGTLLAFANAMKLYDVAEILAQTLAEEKELERVLEE